MKDLILSIDRGTSNIKVILYDLNGNEVKSLSKKCENIQHPKPGWSEQNMDYIWKQTKDAIHEILYNDINKSQIKSIGLCGQGNGVFLLDKNGNPVRNGILSLDTRASDYIKRWKENGVYKKIKKQIHSTMSTNNPGPIMRWIKDNEYENYKKTKWIIFSKDWVKFKLTGEISTDQSDASGALLMNLKENRYSKEIFKYMGIEECFDKLPTIIPTWEIAGKVTKKVALETGLKEGTPVTSGAHDIASCSWGAGGIQEGHLTLIVGTWGLNLLVIDELKKINNKDNNFYSLHAIPERYLAFNGDGNSGSSLKWFVEKFCKYENKVASEQDISVYQYLDRKIKNKFPTNIIYHPYIFGTMKNSKSRAGFIGLADWHNKEEIIRSVYEGIAFSHRMYIESLKNISEINEVFLVGGGAKSNVWPQIFADITGLNIKVPQINEVASRGNMLSAAIGAGVFNDHNEASNLSIPIKKEYYPQIEFKNEYNELYNIYKSIQISIKEHWKELDELSNA